MLDRRGALLLFYDLSVATRKQRRSYWRFRTGIKKLGFRRFQESVYIKVLKNISVAPSVTRQVDEIAPEGSVCLLPLSLDNCMRIVTIRGDYRKISELFNTFIEA